MIRLLVTREAYDAILATLARDALVREPRLVGGQYALWLPKTAVNQLWANRRRGEDLSDTIIRIAQF